jgi:NAD(P)-dependent dehydrogenase (short-subunit alcohol dehydrogenase family)
MATIGTRLAGKVALVSGIGSGIGQGCALMFARQGARVMGCDLDVATAESTVKAAAAEGLDLRSTHPVDLTKPTDVQRVVAATVQAWGHIDILLNAAAWAAFEWIEQMDYQAHWRRTLEAELDSVFLMCQTSWPHLKTRGGSIINFASANAWTTLQHSGALAHCAGKGGVLAMTRQLAMEGAPHRIRANTISPGLVVTTATRTPLEHVPGFRENALAKHMIPRLGTPEDIAWCATYLASDEATWVTAADFTIDGGATKW